LIPNLRYYQKAAIERVYEWMSANRGNPCIEAPTGSGKSHIIAGLCEDVMSRWGYNVLILSHVKELLEQDAEKILAAWPEAPIAVYCAGLRQKRINSITVASIQSIWRKAELIKQMLGRIELVIVDEAHLINNRAHGMYRKFMDDLAKIEPRMRVIGLTATPYRLGQGMITEGEGALFSEIITPVTIQELVAGGYLAQLVSKMKDIEMSNRLTRGVRKVNGDYARDELEKNFNTEDNNEYIVRKTMELAEGRKAWLVFCTGVQHAFDMRDTLRNNGISAETVTGETPVKERAQILDDFKAGRIKALTNVNVLTTGFDYPDIDLIVMVRPTLSPGLYVQMAGRGMRVKSGEYKDCAVLDFAGNIDRHGPVTGILPPDQGEHNGVKPTKTCEKCGTEVSISTKVCPECGFVFPVRGRDDAERKPLNPDADIMERVKMMTPSWWRWYSVSSRKSGVPMLRVDFLPKELTGQTVPLFLCVNHGGYAQMKALQIMSKLLRYDCRSSEMYDTEKIAAAINRQGGLFPCPKWIKYVAEGTQKKKFYKLLDCGWEQEMTGNEAAV